MEYEAVCRALEGVERTEEVKLVLASAHWEREVLSQRMGGKAQSRFCQYVTKLITGGARRRRVHHR